MNVHSRAFPRVTNEWPFQEHLPNKTILLTPSSALQELQTMNVLSRVIPNVTYK